MRQAAGGQAVNLGNDAADDLDGLGADEDAAQRLGIFAGEDLVHQGDACRRQRQLQDVRGAKRATGRSADRPAGYGRRSA